MFHQPYLTSFFYSLPPFSFRIFCVYKRIATQVYVEVRGQFSAFAVLRQSLYLYHCLVSVISLHASWHMSSPPTSGIWDCRCASLHSEDKLKLSAGQPSWLVQLACLLFCSPPQQPAPCPQRGSVGGISPKALKYSTTQLHLHP